MTQVVIKHVIQMKIQMRFALIDYRCCYDPHYRKTWGKGG